MIGIITEKDVKSVMGKNKGVPRNTRSSTYVYWRVPGSARVIITSIKNIVSYFLPNKMEIIIGSNNNVWVFSYPQVINSSSDNDKDTIPTFNGMVGG